MKVIFNALLFLFLFTTMTCQAQEEMKDLEKSEIIALYEEYSGKQIKNERNLCVRKARNFTGVAALGSFAYDRGCRGNELIVGEKIGVIKDLTSETLHYFNWEDQSQRENLSLNWTLEVVYAWYSVMNKPNEDFELSNTPNFSAPQSQKVEDTWEVILWLREPAGMRKVRKYFLARVRYNEAGELIEQEVIDNFKVEF